MKILFWGSSGSPRKDTCTDEMHMARYLVGEGNEVVVCTDQDVCDELKTKNQTIMGIPNLKRGELDKKDIETVLAYDYDVVFAASLTYAPFANFFARKKGVESIVQILDIPLWRFGLNPKGEQWQSMHPLLNSSDLIIANTKVTEDILIKMGFPKEKIKRIYIGVNHLAIEKAVGHKSDNSICCVSRCAFHKAPDLGLYAFNMADVDSPLKMIGHGEEQRRLELLAIMMNMNVKFLGFISERKKIREIKRSLFGIYPDICPTIGGLFPLESLACGKPCIVWDTEINRDRFHDCVEYVPLYDVKEFAENIEYLVNNPDYRKRRGEKGKEWVLKNRTYKLYAEKLTEVLSERC